jgi:hypothetical protein
LLDAARMIVQDELRIATAEDIPVYAAGRRVWRTVREAVMAAQGSGSEIAPDVWACVEMVTSLIAAALRAPDAETELLRWRQTETMLDVLRSDVYAMLRERSLSNAMFDEITRAANRCRDEVAGALRHAKGRAWAQLQGVPATRRLLRGTDDEVTRVRRRPMALPTP